MTRWRARNFGHLDRSELVDLLSYLYESVYTESSPNSDLSTNKLPAGRAFRTSERRAQLWNGHRQGARGVGPTPVVTCPPDRASSLLLSLCASEF